MVLEGSVELDKAFAALLPPGQRKGRASRDRRSDRAVATGLATIHTIAIRARAGVPRKELEAIVKGAIDLMLRAA